jgi:predicted nucleic acid-binding protein
MVSPSGYLVDTNILLRLSRLDDPSHETIDAPLNALKLRGIDFHFSIQNITEFWNVSTRPAERNGYDLSIAEANFLLKFIESTMTFLPDNDQVYAIWRQLVVAHNVRGVQVHDARLAAIMQAYGLTHILTLNTGDFERFPDIVAVHPGQVPAKSV